MSRPLGAELVVRGLERLGVDLAFGLPGTQNVALFEALRRSSIRVVVPTNETAAAFMANGYARASGRAAVLLTIPGPGFAYAIPGLAEARLDSAPLVHVVGAPATGPGRAFQLQAIDQRAIASSLVKRVLDAASVDELEPLLFEAHAEATAGEPGPVLLQIPGALLEAEGPSAEAPMPAAAIEPPPPAGTLDEIAAALRSARRRAILVGQGACDAAPAVRRLLERLACPVFSTTSGRGVVPEDAPESLGRELEWASPAAVEEFAESRDLVLALGCKFSHNGSRGFRLRIPAQRLVHVDASAGVLGAVLDARWAVRADVGAFVDALLPRLGDSPLGSAAERDADVAEWRRKGLAEAARTGAEPRFEGVPGGAAEFFAALRRALPRDGVVVTDSGLHQMLARKHFPVLSPRSLLVPADFQSMGFGLPAAIGARAAAPDRPVTAIVGDGGMAISGLETLTAVREGLSLTVVVLNDGGFGLIRAQQWESSGHAHGTDLPPPDFEALAAATGADYRLLADPAALEGLGTPGRTTLVEVRVGPSVGMVVRRAKAIALSAAGRAPRRWLRRLRG